MAVQISECISFHVAGVSFVARRVDTVSNSDLSLRATKVDNEGTISQPGEETSLIERKKELNFL